MGNFKQDNRSDRRNSGRFSDNHSKRFSRGDSHRFRGRDSNRFERNPEQLFEKKMHTVICDKCGERCEVPFRPTEGKPVYCYNCFKNQDNSESKHSTSKNEFDQINEKLNKIMKRLEIK